VTQSGLSKLVTINTIFTFIERNFAADVFFCIVFGIALAAQINEETKSISQEKKEVRLYKFLCKY